MPGLEDAIALAVFAYGGGVLGVGDACSLIGTVWQSSSISLPPVRSRMSKLSVAVPGWVPPVLRLGHRAARWLLKPATTQVSTLAVKLAASNLVNALSNK